MRDYLDTNPILWIKTSVLMKFLSRRMVELKNTQVALSRIRSSIGNYKTLTCLIMHLIRHVAVTPVPKLTFLRRVLLDLQFNSVMEHSGMFFLHDFDFDRGTLGDIWEDDGPEADRVMCMAKTKHCPSKRVINTTPNSIFPLGNAPSWQEVVATMANNPELLLRPWTWDKNYGCHQRASDLFIEFTGDIWLSLNEGHLQIPMCRPENLKGAMETWTYASLAGAFKCTTFIATNHGLEGPIQGRRSSSFRDMAKIFFPPLDTDFPINSPWKQFSESGYIKLYHKVLAGTNQQFQENLDLALSFIFGKLQCLPHSKPGRIWNANKGSVQFLTNPLFYKLQKIGPALVKKRGSAIRLKANPIIITARLDAEHKGIPLKMAKSQQRMTRKALKVQKQATIAKARAQRRVGGFAEGELCV
jgi:hypothetical protein